jgi:hypothetical protein
MSDSPSLNCADERRRRAVRAKPLNGIDSVDVSGDQRTLSVDLLGEIPEELTAASIRIEGGRRIRGIRVLSIEPGMDCLRVFVDRPGDFSTYTLRIVAVENGKPTDRPFPGFDPRYAKAQFSFKINCPSDMDCLPDTRCPPEPRREPEINYLAKDYASFRQLILDRLALILPGWHERQVPDPGITLVEILAYVGDYLSYYQDAVATEAYLDTARLRISVRRHTRLIDYPMHEGCNARAFVCLEVDAVPPMLSPGDFYFIVAGPQASDPLGDVLSEPDLRGIPPDRYEAFEPLLPAAPGNLLLYQAHNRIRFYTWGDAECCLPRGTTSATLLDGPPDPAGTPEEYDDTPDAKPPPGKGAPAGAPAHADSESPDRLHLKPGDILLFEEVRGPRTGVEADADPAHRHAVRITHVEHDVDPLNGQHVVEITWAAADALPFPLCLSAIGEAPECALLEDVSIARGNVVLVEHGRCTEETLDPVEPSDLIAKMCEGEGQPADVVPAPKPFEPLLRQGPLSFHAPLDLARPASTLLTQDPRQAAPWIELTEPLAEPAAGKTSLPAQTTWTPRRDLLRSRRSERAFVVEMDNDGIAHLRFGDGELGRAPTPGTRFTATYHVGNGAAGNVSAEMITHLVLRTPLSGANLKARNPMAAQGGIDPEPLAAVKLLAPGAFRKRLERAVSADDYARLAERNSGVQRAAAALYWTGSWYEASVGIDPLGAEEAPPRLLRDVEGLLHRYRRMGHALAVTQARHVPLDITVEVCVKPHYLRGHVEGALRELFSDRLLPDGRRGLFHPDALTFGDAVTVSRLVAAAQAVEGVQNVQVTKLERLYDGPNGEIERGILTLGPLEIARVDNDPSFPENGRVTLKIGGGR